MTDENVNEETQDEAAAEPQAETTDAPEGVADVENVPEEAAPEQSEAAPEPEASAEPAEPESTEEPAEGPPPEEPAAEPAEEPAAEAESTEEPAEGPPADEPAAEEPAADEPTDAPETAEPEASAEAEPPSKPAEPEPEPEPAAAPAAGPKPKRKRLPRSLRRQRSKPTRERPAERKPIARVPRPEHERGRRQERQGTVVSAAADKTIVVRVDTVKVHPMYKKVIKRSTKLHAHDETNEAKVGDIVRLVETRPLSKLKRWRLQEIVEAAK
jgi:small subunit ribosomal protein S17